jgi:hypothetical protein
MNPWWCMDCRDAVKLDKHGRCGICASEAVDLIEPRGEITRSVSDIQRECVDALASA